tara:strand:+ start:164 stop:370 length:207 start_codon:yes stop_codon:yes gene_type:complete
MILISKRFIFLAKRNLYKDQAAWSGKDIKIKYSKKVDSIKSNQNENYLKVIADESKNFLEEESSKGNE